MVLPFLAPFLWVQYSLGSLRLRLRGDESAWERPGADSAEAMLAKAHALGLPAFGRDLGDELHLGAFLQVLEQRALDVLRREVVVVALGRLDEAEAFLGIQAHKLAAHRQRMQLLLAAHE